MTSLWLESPHDCSIRQLYVFFKWEWDDPLWTFAWPTWSVVSVIDHPASETFFRRPKCDLYWTRFLFPSGRKLLRNNGQTQWLKGLTQWPQSANKSSLMSQRNEWAQLCSLLKVASIKDFHRQDRFPIHGNIQPPRDVFCYTAPLEQELCYFSS